MQSTKWGGIVLGLILLVGVVGTAGASERGPGKAMGPGSSEADIDVAFSDGCTDFDVESTKGISFVSVNHDDGRYDKDELGGDQHTYGQQGDDPIKSIVVKSGTSRVVANCDGDGPVVIDPDELPECSNAEDDDGDGFTDHPADPQCETPDDDDEGDGGDGGGEEPDTEGPPGDPTCSDGIDNDGDGLADGDDPDCQDVGGEADPCTGDAGDAGLLTDDTLGQTLFDGGLAIDPLTEDPDADGVISGPLHGLGADTPLEVVTDEAACLVDLLISGETSPLDP